jgi:hypothetical protein
MASVSSNNKMVIIPFKKATEVNFAGPIKRFIMHTNAANLDGYLKSADALNKFRSDALFNICRHNMLSKLTRYHDQLMVLEGKFPISESQIRIKFKWNDAFDNDSLFGRSLSNWQNLL